MEGNHPAQSVSLKSGFLRPNEISYVIAEHDEQESGADWRAGDLHPLESSGFHGALFRQSMRWSRGAQLSYAFDALHASATERSEEHTSELQSRENIVC